MTNLDTLLNTLEQSFTAGQFVKLIASDYHGGDAGLKQIHARKTIIKAHEKISVTYRYQTRDIVKNYDLLQAVTLLRDQFENGFCEARLFTTQNDWHFIQRPGRETVWKSSPPSQNQLPDANHDRAKSRVVKTNGQSYLHALGITDAAGNVHPTAQDKYRQIDKYVEIVSGLLKTLPIHAPLRIADMGSGKGYLTFALYDYIANTLGLAVEMTGIEFRADLVALCNSIAATSGFQGLRFAEGAIADYDASGAHVVIALHACDTATDDAIAKAIATHAELIVTAPCCHKQIRQEMEKSRAASGLDFLLKHGTMLERQAEMVTDGMRALILEHFGYRTKLFEFISDAHTPKNVMIVATREGKSKRSAQALATLHAAKVQFGIGSHALERLTGLAP